MRPQLSRAARRRRVIVRRLMRRFERGSKFWMEVLPTWGISIALHAAVLIVMALIYLTQPAPDSSDGFKGAIDNQTPIGDDLTSIAAADRAGDPFTTSDAKEYPSLGLTAASNETTTARPRMPEGVRFSPMVAAPSMNITAPGVKLTDAINVNTRGMGTMHIENLSAPFSGRDPEMKAKLIRRQGGTVASEKAVTDGLDWLARHQKPDGSWSLDCHSQCKGEGCPAEPAMVSDVAATGLAILPMLGAGHIHTKDSKYKDNIRRGLAWLMKQQKRDGELFTQGTRNSLFYTHAIGAMALCEAYGISRDQGLRTPAQRSLNYIIKNQNLTDGGWRYYAGQPGDTSVFGWQIFALRSGRLAGFDTPKTVADRCRKFLDLARTDVRGSRYAYLVGGPPTAVMTAEGLLCRQYLGWNRDYPPLREGTALVAAELRESNARNIYYWYYATQLLHNMQDKDWKEWNQRVRDGLISMQTVGNGCDRGSWDPNFPQQDAEGRRAGRLYTTALSVLTLEVYYRFLPLYRVPGEEEGSEDEPKADAAKEKEKEKEKEAAKEKDAK